MRTLRNIGWFARTTIGGHGREGLALVVAVGPDCPALIATKPPVRCLAISRFLKSYASRSPGPEKTDKDEAGASAKGIGDAEPAKAKPLYGLPLPF